MKHTLFDTLSTPPDPDIAGEGTRVAVIDQTLRRKPSHFPKIKCSVIHPAIANCVKVYHASGRNVCYPYYDAFHGSTMLSFIAGRAPDERPMGLATQTKVDFFEQNHVLPEVLQDAYAHNILTYQVGSYLNIINNLVKIGRPFDAVVFYTSIWIDESKRSTIDPNDLQMIAGVEKTIETLKAQNIGVFHPAEFGSLPFYPVNTDGQNAYTDCQCRHHTIALPIHGHWVVDAKSDGLIRNEKYIGVCMVNAMLTGGFAMMRQKNRHLTQESYYQLLIDTARPVEYKKGTRVLTVDWSRALRKLSNG